MPQNKRKPPLPGRTAVFLPCHTNCSLFYRHALHQSLLLEEKVPRRGGCGVAAKRRYNVTNSPIGTEKRNLFTHTTSVKNRFRRADFCQLLLKEKPLALPRHCDNYNYRISYAERILATGRVCPEDAGQSAQCVTHWPSGLPDKLHFYNHKMPASFRRGHWFCYRTDFAYSVGVMPNFSLN